MATLPVVFAELARQYSPSKVSDPASPIAAANGQYILIRRETYDAIGGHAAIADDILEDVALARAVKKSGRKIRFRYAADRVRTRMYRKYRQLRDGWTKNLSAAVPEPRRARREDARSWWAFPLAQFAGALRVAGCRASLVVVYARRRWSFLANTMRLRRANFDLAMEFLGALFGMPMFAYLLLRSKRAHANGSVNWKGRTYGPKNDPVSPLIDHTPTPAGRLS